MQFYASRPKICRIGYGYYNCYSISAIYGNICNALKFRNLHEDMGYRSPLFSASIAPLTLPLTGKYYSYTDRIEIEMKYSNTGYFFHKINKSKSQFIILKRMHPLLGKVHIYKI